MTKNILEWLEASCQKHPGKIAVAEPLAKNIQVRLRSQMKPQR